MPFQTFRRGRDMDPLVFQRYVCLQSRGRWEASLSVTWRSEAPLTAQCSLSVIQPVSFPVVPGPRPALPGVQTDTDADIQNKPTLSRLCLCGFRPGHERFCSSWRVCQRSCFQHWRKVHLNHPSVARSTQWGNREQRRSDSEKPWDAVWSTHTINFIKTRSSSRCLQAAHLYLPLVILKITLFTGY